MITALYVGGTVLYPFLQVKKLRLSLFNLPKIAQLTIKEVKTKHHFRRSEWSMYQTPWSQEDRDQTEPTGFNDEDTISGFSKFHKSSVNASSFFINNLYSVHKLSSVLPNHYQLATIWTTETALNGLTASIPGPYYAFFTQRPEWWF